MNWDWSKTFVVFGIIGLTVVTIAVYKVPAQAWIFGGGLLAVILYSAVTSGWNLFRYDRNQSRHQDAEE